MTLIRDGDMKNKYVPYPYEYFEKLAAVEADYWWFRSRNRIILWVMKKWIGDIYNFMEVGCGTGYVLSGVHDGYPDSKLTGCEYYEEGLQFASVKIPSADFIQLDARSMAYKEEFDVVAAFDVIEHIEEDELVLSNLAKSIKEGGFLLLTVPQHRWLWSVVDEKSCHVRRYTKKELIEKIEHTGLQIKYLNSFVSLLLPIMLLTRFRSRRETYDPMSEFMIPPVVNVFLEVIMKIELKLIKLGIKFRFGGSLIMLAKKC